MKIKAKEFIRDSLILVLIFIAVTVAMAAEVEDSDELTTPPLGYQLDKSRAPGYMAIFSKGEYVSASRLATGASKWTDIVPAEKLIARYKDIVGRIHEAEMTQLELLVFELSERRGIVEANHEKLFSLIDQNSFSLKRLQQNTALQEYLGSTGSNIVTELHKKMPNLVTQDGQLNEQTVANAIIEISTGGECIEVVNETSRDGNVLSDSAPCSFKKIWGTPAVQSLVSQLKAELPKTKPNFTYYFSRNEGPTSVSAVWKLIGNEYKITKATIKLSGCARGTVEHEIGSHPQELDSLAPQKTVIAQPLVKSQKQKPAKKKK